MVKNIVVGIGVVILAFSILFVSVMRATQIKFTISGSGHEISNYESYNIPYQLAYSGKILPNHFLWPAKVVRDKAWLFVTTNPNQKANLLLLFADKRLDSSVKLLDEGDYEESLSTLLKAESYLERASLQEKENRLQGLETGDTLRLLSYASLKHYDVMNSMREMFPDDARVVILDAQKMPKLVYENSRDAMRQKGVEPPENPFEW